MACKSVGNDGYTQTSMPSQADADHDLRRITMLAVSGKRGSEIVIPEFTRPLIASAAVAGKSVNCFDFVPSDYEEVWKVLREIRHRFGESAEPSFCEWGSGLGVVTGMAEILGFRASGIEIDATLAEQSRELLKRHGLQATIVTGSYLETTHTADVIFVYCWPSRMLETQQHFIDAASEDALLLICHGASDVRCRTKIQIVQDQ